MRAAGDTHRAPFRRSDPAQGSRDQRHRPPTTTAVKRSLNCHYRRGGAMIAGLDRTAYFRLERVTGAAMAEYDLVIRNGTVGTAADAQDCDVGIKYGLVASLAGGPAAGA